MMRYTIKELDHPRHDVQTDDWRETVLGLNSAMDCVDAPYPELKVIDNDTGQVIYSQPGGSPP